MLETAGKGVRIRKPARKPETIVIRIPNARKSDSESHIDVLFLSQEVP